MIAFHKPLPRGVRGRESSDCHFPAWLLAGVLLVVVFALVEAAGAQANQNGQRDLDKCLASSRETMSREEKALGPNPDTAPLAPGHVRLATGPHARPQVDAIQKAKDRRDGECIVEMQIWQEMHDKTIAAILAKQHAANEALYAQYKMTPGVKLAKADKGDPKHKAVWGYLLYQNPGYNVPVPNIGEEDTMIYTQVMDLTTLQAPPDREAYVERAARMWERMGRESQPVDETILADQKMYLRAVEWFLGWLATDFQIRPGRNGGINFYGMDAGHIGIADGDWTCQKQGCHFASREEAEAERQKNMKLTLSINKVIRQVVEMHEH